MAMALPQDDPTLTCTLRHDAGGSPQRQQQGHPESSRPASSYVNVPPPTPATESGDASVPPVVAGYGTAAPTGSMEGIGAPLPLVATGYVNVTPTGGPSGIGGSPAPTLGAAATMAPAPGWFVGELGRANAEALLADVLSQQTGYDPGVFVVRLGGSGR